MDSHTKINVGVFSDVYYPMIDGVVKVLENQVKHLKDRVNFYLIVPDAPKEYEEKSIGEKQLIRVKSIKIFFLDYKMATPNFDCKLKKELKDIPLDLILVHSPFGMGKYGLKVAKKRKIPSIIYAHSLLKQDFRRNTKSRLLTAIMLRAIIKRYQKASVVVPVGKGVKNVYLNEYKMKNKTHVINNATDMVFLNDIDKVNSLKESYSIKDNELVFSFLGRINKLKGIYLIADSLKIVKDNNIEFKAFFIGDGLDLEPFKEYCDKIGISDHVIFPGTVRERKEIAAYLQMSDLFLFPSFYDTNSLVQIEAASQKTPSLLAIGSTTAYGLVDGHNCFLANYTPKEYAKRIIELNNDRKLLSEMREKVYQNMYRTWENSANQLYDLMIETIKNNKK